MATYTTLSPTLKLTQLNFLVRDKKTKEPVSNRCVGIPVTLITNNTIENYIFWSMPTDVLGKISLVMAHSGVSNSCNGTTYTMSFSTTGCSIAIPINDWPMGCCQITLTCGRKFCYSAPNIYGYAECLCDKLDKIFRCLGIGSAEWSEGFKCNYETGLCDGNALVELSRLDAVPSSKAVRIVWSTDAEIDTAGFNIYRSEMPEGPYQRVNDSLLPARGTAFEGVSYEFLDTAVLNRKTYYYKLEDVELSGDTALHGPVSATPSWWSGLVR